MDYKTIITSFKQHGFGNCTSIGVIKAAIDIFGVGGVFSTTNTNGDLKVTLKNTKTLNLLASEIAYAQQNCGFQLLENTSEKKEITEYAKTCFAVISKYKQINEGYKSYEEAVDDINNGENASEAPMYLGLEQCIVPVAYKDVRQFPGIVAHSVHHTVFVSHGYYDNYGEANPLDSIGEWIRFGRKLYRFNNIN